MRQSKVTEWRKSWLGGSSSRRSGSTMGTNSSPSASSRGVQTGGLNLRYIQPTGETGLECLH